MCTPKIRHGHFTYLAQQPYLTKFCPFQISLSPPSLLFEQEYRELCRFSDGYHVCQLQKDGLLKTLGVKKPFEPPQRRWRSICIDFITKGPETAKGLDEITAFVDIFSRRVHCCTSKYTYSDLDVPNFFREIFRHHGIHYSLIWNRDPRFTANYLGRLTPLCDRKLRMSSSHHTRIDLISRAMNRMMENYISCYCSHHQRDWDRLITAQTSNLALPISSIWAALL